jgi:hypothetical protein
MKRMMNKMNTKVFAISLGVILFFNSCKKDDPETPIIPTDITLPCDYFKSNRTLVNDTNKAVDYIINCVMDVEANITVEPGVVIQFAEDAGIVVRSGFFKAIGTAEKPIQLKGSQEIPGFWKGIYFQNGSLQNELTYTHISSSGGSAFDSNGDRGSVLLFGPGKVKMNHSKIEKSGHFGLNAPYSNCEFDVKNTLFTNCTKAPFNIEPEYMPLIDLSNTYTNNSENYIAVQLNGGVLNGNSTIQALSIPYRIYQVSGFYEWLIIANGMVTFNGPVVIQFNDILGITVEPNGGISLEGSPNTPARLTGTNQVAGSWKGIYFNNTQLNNQLYHTIIEYAGSLADGHRYGISMWNNPRVTISNSTFRNINGCAIFDYNDANNPNPNLNQSNNNFENVNGGEICHP